MVERPTRKCPECGGVMQQSGLGAMGCTNLLCGHGEPITKDMDVNEDV